MHNRNYTTLTLGRTTILRPVLLVYSFQFGSAFPPLCRNRFSFSLSAEKKIFSSCDLTLSYNLALQKWPTPGQDEPAWQIPMSKHHFVQTLSLSLSFEHSHIHTQQTDSISRTTKLTLQLSTSAPKNPISKIWFCKHSLLRSWIHYWKFCINTTGFVFMMHPSVLLASC